MAQRVSPWIGPVALLAALALAGCGRKGPLELPPGAPPETAQSTDAQQRILPREDSPALIQPPNQFVDKPAAEKLNQAAQSPSKPITTPTTSDKPFFLDPLL